MSIKCQTAVFISLMIWSLTPLCMEVTHLPPLAGQPEIITPQGRRVALYEQSHALIISASHYPGVAKKGWRELPSTRSEMDQVALSLQKHGFHVVRISDPTGDELFRAIRDFGAEYGRVRESRLLFFFSGHGYTNPNTGQGYLVPIDAADPAHNPVQFYNKAMPIKQLELFALEIEVRHAVFFFDSCFSGSIFTKKGPLDDRIPSPSLAAERWRYLAEKSREPVRQFIAAGGAKETLPAKSQFVPLFLRSLMNDSPGGDGYITSKQIGSWLEQTVPSINPFQTPHSDVIRDPGYIFGDMVFKIPGAAISPNLPREAIKIETENRPQNVRGQPQDATRSVLPDLKKVEGIEWSWPLARTNRLNPSVISKVEKGIDIKGRMGEPVYAAADGKIMYVGNGIRGYGNLVIVKSSNSILSAYAHNSETLVKEGQDVKRGDLIAKMGDTDATETKLRFEIRLQGKPVDVFKFLPDLLIQKNIGSTVARSSGESEEPKESPNSLNSEDLKLHPNGKYQTPAGRPFVSTDRPYPIETKF